MRPDNEELFSALQDFFSKNHNNLPPGTDEWYQEKSRAFTSRQQAIVDRMLTGTIASRNDGFTLFGETIDAVGTTRLTLRAEPPALPVTLQAKDVEITYVSTQPVGAINPVVYAPQFTVIDSKSTLRIGKHMDEPTREQVEHLLATENIKPTDLFTMFIFRDDHYAQISGFPGSIIDPLGRENFDKSGSGKLVLSDFTDTSVDTVDRTLSVLEQFR